MTSSNCHRVQYFLLKLHTSFLLTNVYKRVFRIFFIFFRSSVSCKNKKRTDFYTLFYIFINNARFKQNKKNSEHDVYIVKWEMCEKFWQKILNVRIVGACQSFQFFRQIAWFRTNNRVLSKFRYQIVYNLISITKL